MAGFDKDAFWLKILSLYNEAKENNYVLKLDEERVRELKSLYIDLYIPIEEIGHYDDDKLMKKELEARMKVRVDFVETATGKEKRDYDRNNLWEGLEYVRQEVVCEEAYYDAIVKWEENKYTLPTSHHSGNIAT